VLKELGVDVTGKCPPGQLYHAEGPADAGGTWVFDVWESEEALFSFVEQRLAPIMSKLGVSAPQPKILQVQAQLTP
jgi:hypothetical protein